MPCWTQECFCMIDAWMLSVICGYVTSVYLLLNYWENSYFRLVKTSVNRLCAGNLLQIIFQNRTLVLLFSEICMPAKCHIIFPAPFLLSWMRHSPYLPQWRLCFCLQHSAQTLWWSEWKMLSWQIFLLRLPVYGGCCWAFTESIWINPLSFPSAGSHACVSPIALLEKLLWYYV